MSIREDLLALPGTAALFDAVARIARHEVAARAVAAVGTVTEAFPADGSPVDHAVSVQLRDTHLLLPRVPVAVGVLGFAAIPAVGDLVVILFCGGDMHDPVVVGRLYHPADDPPTHGDGDVVLALPSGSTSPEVTVKITAAPTVDIELPSSSVKLSLSDNTAEITVGNLSAKLDGSGSGQITIDAGGQATLMLSGSGDAKLSASGKFSVEASTIELVAQAEASVQASVVKLN